MSKVLVVVYSWTGTSRRLGESLASAQRWTLAEIHDAVSGRGNFRCILDSLLRRRPAIRYEGPDPRDFDAVVLVSPIWAGRLAGPMRSFVRDHAPGLKRVAAISVMGGQGATNAFAEIDQILGRPPILSTAFTAREVDNGSYSTGLAAFGSAVSGNVKEGEALRPSTLSPSAA